MSQSSLEWTETTHRANSRGEVMGIPFDNVSMSEAVDQLESDLERPGMTKVAFINADCLNLAWNREAYQSTLLDADRVYADGVGVRMAGRILGCQVHDNVNGTDLFPHLCDRISRTKTRLFLLGGKPGVAEQVRSWVHKNYPGVEVCGVHHGYFSQSEEARIIEAIVVSEADLVLVAFGAPKQDQWIRDSLRGTRVRVAIGVGGLFDFYSGRIPRAPKWMRAVGLEWTYRLYQEPRRLWRRYIIGNVVFLARAIILRLVSIPLFYRQPEAQES